MSFNGVGLLALCQEAKRLVSPSGVTALYTTSRVHPLYATFSGMKTRF